MRGTRRKKEKEVRTVLQLREKKRESERELLSAVVLSCASLQKEKMKRGRWRYRIGQLNHSKKGRVQQKSLVGEAIMSRGGSKGGFVLSKAKRRAKSGEKKKIEQKEQKVEEDQRSQCLGWERESMYTCVWECRATDQRVALQKKRTVEPH